MFKIKFKYKYVHVHFVLSKYGIMTAQNDASDNEKYSEVNLKFVL